MEEIINNQNELAEMLGKVEQRKMLESIKEAVLFSGNYNGYLIDFNTYGNEVCLTSFHPSTGNSFNVYVEDIDDQKFKLVLDIKEEELVEGFNESIGKHTFVFEHLDFILLGRILNSDAIVDCLNR